MKQQLSHKDVFKQLVKLDELIWEYFHQYETDKALSLNHQFFYYYNKHKKFLDLNNIFVNHLLSKQNIIYQTLGGLDDDKNTTIAQDYNKFIYYETDIDTNEVLNFRGFLKINKTIDIEKVYKHIDWYLDKYENTKENISVVFNYHNNKPNPNNIEFEVSYENDGLIHIHLNKYGVFKGETLSLLKDTNFDYEDDFLKKVDDIYQHFKKYLK